MYERFEALLKKRGLKAADVAKATGIGRSTFTDWKTGRSRPKQEKLQKIADYLGTTVSYLLGAENTVSSAGDQQGIIIGFGGEQERISITESEYDTIKSILKTLRNQDNKRS